MSLRRIVVLVFAGFIASAASAAAQPIGTFRWQLQPYCNIITVNVTQQGGIYTLDGTDDRCGGGNQPGSVVGIAYLTPLGLVGFGLTSVLPSGTPIHTEATISIASLSGTWRDSAGNNGTFTFTPGAGSGGALRPIPSGGIAPASITNIQIASNAVSSTNVIDASITTADLAAPSRAAFTGGGGLFLIDAAGTIVRSISITVPSAGKVIVNAQGLFDLDPASVEYGACNITTGTTVIPSNAVFVQEATAASMNFVPFANTRGFDVIAGTNTFNLVCYEISGNLVVQYPMMTAVFIPQ